MIFLTGSEGFIGSRLCQLCDERGLNYIRFDQALGHDIRDALQVEELMPEGATVIHMAALSTVKACEEAGIITTHKINVAGTQHVLDAARRKHAKQLILASSEWVYEGPGVNSYTDSKLAAERLVERFSEGLATILRFGIVYGQGARSAVNYIFADVQSDGHVTYGNASTARRYIHVDDLCAGILASIGHAGTFDLTGNEKLTLCDVALAAFRVCGGPISIDNLGEPMSVRDIPNDATKSALGWEPKINLEAGLRTLMETGA